MGHLSWGIFFAIATAGAFYLYIRWKTGFRQDAMSADMAYGRNSVACEEEVSSAPMNAMSAREVGSDAGVARVSVPNPPRPQTLMSLGPRGFHRLAYTEWGDSNNPHIVVCVHGFTRNSHDFDVLAAHLADRCRVVSVDMVGRGESDWLENKDDYDYSLYLSDAAALLARLMPPPPPEGENAESPVTQVDWIGTSMGGLIGMMLAAKVNAPIRRLVLNDVGPMIPWAALTRLRNIHLKQVTRFRSLEQVEAHLREVYATFGELDDDLWKYVVRHSARQLEDGNYILTYDPAIMYGMNHARRGGVEFGHNFFAGVDMWPIWDRVQCNTLVLRGGVSDVLLASTAREMERRGPKAEIVEFPGIGHAPWLMAPDQVSIVR
ncbi:MAG: alpha/beta fold hydrolase, partial [Sulfurifustis sp.]